MLRQQLESERLQGEWLKRDLGICAEKQKDAEAENEALRRENEALKASPPSSPVPEIDPLELAEWHKQYLAANPKSKATYSDFRKILKILQQRTEASEIPYPD